MRPVLEDLQGAAGVLLVGPVPPPHGGVAIHVVTLAHRLRAEGLPVAVVDPASLRRGDGVLARAGAAARLTRRLARGARAHRALHLHVNGHNLSSWLLATIAGHAASAAPARLLTVHSGLIEEFLDAGSGGRRRLVRHACGTFSRVIAVSEPVRDALVRHGVPASAIRVRPAWSDFDRVPERADPPPGIERWLQSHRPVVAATMSFHPEYRFEWLLTALEGIRERHPDAGLIVMGGGGDVEAARSRVRDRALESAVTLCGDVPHETCMGVVARSDALLRPTLADGDALSVREALALGVPVVASDVGSRPPGARLFPVEDADAMVALLREAVAGAAAGSSATGRWSRREAS